MPPPGMVKINFDGVIDFKNGYDSVAAIVIDEEGRPFQWSEHVTLLVVFIPWFIWKSHNHATFKNSFQTPHQVLHLAQAYLDEFQTAIGVPPISLTAPPRSVPWTPPPAGSIKINFDAATDKSNNCGSKT